MEIRIIHALDECRDLWRRVFPEENVSDLWEVRACFHNHFRHKPYFVMAEDQGEIVGLLPLSRIDDRRSLGYFPGETWDGKTWLEQNRMHARDDNVLEAMLSRCPLSYQLRYLLRTDAMPPWRQVVDEIGYLFFPPQYNFSMDEYFGEFSGKSAKRIKKDIASFEDRGIEFRCDDPDDFDLLVDLNVGRFGSSSYFFDPRFRDSFRDLMNLMRERGWLRMTTVLVGGEVAAIDMGCMYRDAYTVMAGGTNGNFPGIAKLINIHHMTRACDERLQQVDFLCGDFSWKSMFHLSPRPLYLLSNVSVNIRLPESVAMASVSGRYHGLEYRNALHVR